EAAGAAARRAEGDGEAEAGGGSLSRQDDGRLGVARLGDRDAREGGRRLPAGEGGEDGREVEDEEAVVGVDLAQALDGDRDQLLRAVEVAVGVEDAAAPALEDAGRARRGLRLVPALHEV